MHPQTFLSRLLQAGLGPVRRPRGTYLTKKEAAVDGLVEPPARVLGAGVTRAVLQAPPRPHIFDTPSGPTVGGPSRTVSATATAATAASACREGGSHVRERRPQPQAPAHPKAWHSPWAPQYKILPAWGMGQSARAGPHRAEGDTVAHSGTRLSSPRPSSPRNAVTTVVRRDGQGPHAPHPRAVSLGATRGIIREKKHNKYLSQC